MGWPALAPRGPSARSSVCGDDLSVTDLRSAIATSVGPGYDRHAACYDHDTGHFNNFRKRAVSALRLRPGDTVLDVGCGTGLCFPWIQDRIGPSGKLIAVEPSREMLDKAMQRAAQHGWDNVIPINTAAADLDVALSVDAALFCATHDVLRSPSTLANVQSPRTSGYAGGGHGWQGGRRRGCGH